MSLTKEIGSSPSFAEGSFATLDDRQGGAHQAAGRCGVLDTHRENQKTPQRRNSLRQYDGMIAAYEKTMLCKNCQEPGRCDRPVRCIRNR